MASRTIGALQRNVESLAISLDTATRRAEEFTIDGKGVEVPRHPGAAAEVERLTGLHATAMAAMEAKMAAGAKEAGGPKHKRAVSDGAKLKG
jgi:hypothetical protein